jgi:para-nitrobenzyl esterase
VKVAQGVLRGTLEGGLRVFKGVPFAQPPVGPLRFRPAQPPLPWNGVRDAVRNAPAAMQTGQAGSEDCLYLNVWAPPSGGSHPVLVWIHGGGNAGGGTNGQSGASFAREGIVVVTVAYRLGTFGFMEFGEVLGPEYADSGDNGIRDLETALRWVHQNVAAFGGDPARVTIAGQSAGAKDVAALLAAKSTRGLFARAIMHSGGGQTIHTRESAREATAGLLDALGLKGGDARRLLTMPADEILAGQRKLEATYHHNFPFRPFVGGKYMPRRPVDLVEGGVPLLIGTTRDESISFMPRSDAGKPIRSREITNLPFPHVAEMEARYWAAFREDTDLQRRVRLLTAEEYWIPSVRFAEAHARHGGHTWMYRFDHTPTDPRDGHAGFAAHGAELGFSWNAHPGWTMHETWTAFLKGEAPKWPEYDAARRTTMIYGQGGSTSVVSDPRGDERRLWDRVL